MELFYNLHNSIKRNSKNNAFCIDGKFYTYSDLEQSISNIRRAIADHIPIEEKNIGLITNDDLETYASIIALWFEGKCYIPIVVENPLERNLEIINQSSIKTIIDSSVKSMVIKNKLLLNVHSLKNGNNNLAANEINGDELAYILFTSGTTGKPKGVPITRNNVANLIWSFEKIGFNITGEDRCLQMFDLTFDLSVISYLYPLLKGACIYTIPKDKIKFTHAFELMEDYKLTFIHMVPSTISYLRPYFRETNLPLVKYSIFCGEALHTDIVQEWGNCLPNAEILNFYGPTEATIFRSFYNYSRNQTPKEKNGILSIGKAMVNNYLVVVDVNNNILSKGLIGELCIGGSQLTPGYWKNEVKSKESFINLMYNGQSCRFYKTGDSCVIDEDGDIYYLGRIDFQAKIQGFRVELSEVEFHCKKFLKHINAVAVVHKNNNGNTELGLIVESEVFDSRALLGYLKTKIPNYMIPSKIIGVAQFPVNSNDKIDRNSLQKMLQEF